LVIENLNSLCREVTAKMPELSKRAPAVLLQQRGKQLKNIE